VNRKVTWIACRTWLLATVILAAAIASGCAHRLYAPMQPDGWSAQPIVNAGRFTTDADLNPVTGTPVGDEGYFLYILVDAPRWDFSEARALLFTIWLRPLSHSWIMLESQGKRLEFGHTGNFGRVKPAYHEGVQQRDRDGDPNPIAYLWQTMPDGQFQTNKPERPPTFAWKLPITRQKYKRIHDYVMNRDYDKFDLRTNNCTDMAAKTAELAGINLIHRIRLTLPPEAEVWGRMKRIWTDPQYSILEFSSPQVMEADLRQLVQFGIGSDVTEWYLSLIR
jgi:hypothetical protein